MTYYELEDDERDARRFRALLNIEDQNQPDMLTVIVKLKHAGLIDDYERVPDLELPEDEAFWDPDSRTIRLRESIFCAANNQISDPHARWTIWHEIGHALRGHTRLRHRNVSGRLIEKIAPSIRRDERQAHRLAAAMVAPAYKVDDPLAVTAAELAARFNIPFSAAEIRKTELERLYRRANRILRPLPEKGAKYLEEAKRRNKKNNR